LHHHNVLLFLKEISFVSDGLEVGYPGLSERKYHQLFLSITGRGGPILYLDVQVK